MTFSLKQNVHILRTLANLLDEQTYDASVEVVCKGDTLVLHLTARHKEGDKAETGYTAQRLRKSLSKWKTKMEQGNNHQNV